MITNIRIRNFKGLEDIEFSLGGAPVVLVGPNNCGKTSILQALTMWHVGASEWIDNHSLRKNGGVPRGVPIPVSHFLALPPFDVTRLWHKRKIVARQQGKLLLVKIQVDVSGETRGVPWNIGVEFLRANRNTVNCRPIPDNLSADESSADIAARWREVLPQVQFLPPMSGMAWREDKLTPESILSRIGEGRTADVLRNLLYQLANPEGIFSADDRQVERRWKEIESVIREKFYAHMHRPRLSPRGIVLSTYQEDGCEYALSSGGRGFHQTLLMLALLHLRPGGVFLLDEPDAHLEGVRQRDNFSLYSDIAEKHDSQLIIASHSEVVMRQAGAEGIVGVVQGKALPLLNAQVEEFKKLLTSIGWHRVVAAKAAGHVLFLEGSTDAKILAAFAELMFGKAAGEAIRLANVEEIADNVREAWSSFAGLRSGVPKLRGYALFDGDAKDNPGAKEVDEIGEGKMAMQFWRRREIENYILLPEALCRFAEAEDAALRRAESEDPETPGLPLPPISEKTNVELMRKAVEDIIPPIALRDRNDSYWRDQKMSATIVRIMKRFSELRGGVGAWSKWKCHTLVQYMQPDEIPGEVRDKITRILKVIDPDFNPEEF